MEVNEKFTVKSRRDYSLVKKALMDDQKAYAELLSLYQESLYFMLYKMVGNHEDAQDLMIEAFTKAFKSLHKYQPNFAFSTWLFKIASNNCIDFLRNKKTMNKVSIDAKKHSDNDSRQVHFHLKENQLNAEENLIGKQTEEFLRMVVDKLSEDYNVIVSMRYFQDLSYIEIAEKLNIPLGTVKARLYRAKDLLYGMMLKHKNNL